MRKYTSTLQFKNIAVDESRHTIYINIQTPTPNVNP